MTAVDAGPGSAALEAAESLSSAHSVVINGSEIPLSDDLRDSLRELLRHVAAGEEVDVVSRPEYLSTQQAARLLQISRPTVVKMLDEGLIRYERPATHRRIPREALNEYLAAEAEQRKHAMQELAETFDPEVSDEIVSTR